jgi:YesN/AraC family two-component response regulator
MQNHTIVILEKDTLHLCENEAIQINPKKIQIQLLKLFEKEQIFKNPDLKITDVAIKLYTNRTYISTLINTEYSCSFSTFVNQYRVEEAKKELQNEENDNFSLEHVSSLAGFGSLHSFIRVFKEIAGTTPGRYREQHQIHHLTK